MNIKSKNRAMTIVKLITISPVFLIVGYLIAQSEYGGQPIMYLLLVALGILVGPVIAKI